jgi:ribosome-associated heat shock protein Hsp15
MNPDGLSRIDQWLWAVRLYKTRGLAAAACRAEQVRIGDRPVKPSRNVHVGEVVVARLGVVTRTLAVLGLPLSRVGAKLVRNFAEDRTPPEEYAKAREERLQHVLARAPGLGRPTKKERRDLDRFFG